MYTIAILSQKGGAGKTTISCAIAVASERAGKETVVVDLDPQASASKWADLRESDTPIVTSAHAPRLAPVLAAAREAGADLALIDTAAQIADAAVQAARAADLVLIPCRPSAADLTAIAASIDIARIAGTRTIAILNGAPVRNPLVHEARAAIEGYGIEAAPVVIHQRLDHVHAWTAGLTAQEYAPKGKAAAELTELYAWINDARTNSG